MFFSGQPRQWCRGCFFADVSRRDNKVAIWQPSELKRSRDQSRSALRFRRRRGHPGQRRNRSRRSPRSDRRSNRSRNRSPSPRRRRRGRRPRNVGPSCCSVAVTESRWPPRPCKCGSSDRWRCWASANRRQVLGAGRRAPVEEDPRTGPAGHPAGTGPSAAR